MTDEERPERKFDKVTLNVLGSLYDQIKQVVAERDGATITSVVNELLQHALDRAPDWMVKDRSLDEACEVVLHALPDTPRALIREVAVERNRPVAAFILSYCLLAIEQGRVAQLMPEYADPAKVSLTALHETYQGTMRPCEYCGTPFYAKRQGERFCPPPEEGDSCGKKAYKAAYEARRRNRPRTIADAVVEA